MKIHIKNMVCDRCITAVNKVLNDSGVKPVSVILGEAEVAQDIGHSSRKTRYICPKKCGGEVSYFKDGFCPVCKMHLFPAGAEYIFY